MIFFDTKLISIKFIYFNNQNKGKIQIYLFNIIRIDNLSLIKKKNKNKQKQNYI